MPRSAPDAPLTNDAGSGAGLVERATFPFRAAAAVAGATAAFGICAAGLALRLPREPLVRRCSYLLSRMVCAPLGLRVRVRGRERLKAHRPCVIVANHQSMLDIPVLARLFPAGTVIVGKDEIRHMPIVGRLYRATGNLFIDRSRPRSAHRTMQAAEQAVREGRSIWIFPEGTWGTEPGRMLPFKTGAFRLAVATGAPIVPVVVAPLKPGVDLEGGRVRPSTIRIRVLRPIPTAGLGEADVVPLLRETRHHMDAALRRLARSTAKA
jgi:1-acyl-sn-glycerol-3-phosphate acyltransferase